MTTIVALGSNLGDRFANLQGAVDALRTLGIVTAVSYVYETAPMYVIDQPAFLNAAVAVDTTLDPESVIDELLGIERAFGRRRDTLRGPRTLDLDVLAIDDLVVDTDALTVPHPRLAERPFVVFPLRDVAPEWVHPVTGIEVAALARELAEPPRFDGQLRVPSEDRT